MVIFIASCENSPRATITGHITDAEDSTLYLEALTLHGVEVADSCTLDADGAFTFKVVATTHPEFYRLRITRQAINIAVDSVRTISIEATYPTMATNYVVEGYDDCLTIRELATKQITLQGSVQQLLRSGMKRVDINDSINTLIAAYKEDITLNYIFSNPRVASSYYALFQTVGNVLIYDPTNSADVKAIAAVATAWETYYPGTERTENLRNLALESMKNERIVAANAAMTLDEDKIITAGLIEIALPDKAGREVALSHLTGKVVLLDFHLFSLEDSPARILTLRELYNKYADAGFEIYQVAVDGDEHFWLQQCAALPWVCVIADNGLSSQCLVRYNVATVPEYFLIDRSGNLYKRSSQMTDLEEEIKKLL